MLPQSIPPYHPCLASPNTPRQLSAACAPPPAKSNGGAPPYTHTDTHLCKAFD